MYTDHCVGTDVFSTVIAWNTKTYGEKGPQTWADFWDVKKFPGKRSYRKGVAGMLEPALMADGVPPNKVYEVLSAPGGIERAIKKIKELKPHIAVWWASGAQHAQLMKDGEVDMVIGWNGRFDAVAKDGGKVAFTFNQALWDFECFAIPKGAPNKALAMKFLGEVTKPQYQAEFTKRIPYGPTNKKAYDQISAAVAKTLPSSAENVGKQLQIDPNWYIKFEARASELYQNMLTE
jgi:putative spermidine/putrescine transport system substrate-binding protein